MPRVLAASGSLTPITIATLHSGRIAPVDHHLRPLTTNSSPSAVIVVAMFVASDDATAGLGHREARPDLALEQRLEPLRALLVAWRTCDSSSMLPVSGAAQFIASGAIASERPVSSAIGA